MTNKKILLFAGTTEGRMIAKLLSQAAFQTIVSVATEYGESLIEKADNLKIISGRLDKAEMKNLIENKHIHLVIDATHPYAVIVTQNMREVCQEVNIEYLRIVRPPSEESDVRSFHSLEETIDFLNETQGAVLLTTGSKDLEAFTRITDYEERLYPRVLPMAKTLENALAMGYKSSHMICMQGPFSYELNRAMLKQLQIKYMVTKDSGDAGGSQDKLKAARDAGVIVLLIARPQVEQGYTVEEVIKKLDLKLGGQEL
ncbi:MAG: precorrin-6A reductase [Cellulosilyticaceae bacterium]